MLLISPLSFLKVNKPEKPLRSNVLSREALMQRAAELAEQCSLATHYLRPVRLTQRFRENYRILEKAYYTFADSAHEEEVLTAGAEWLLDNYHVIDEQVRDIKRDLPRNYYRALPKLSEGPYRAYPRVYQLACEYISHTDASIESDSLAVFIEAYQATGQSQSILKIGELWAVPIMLRLALVENLRRLALTSLLAREHRRRADVACQTVFDGTTSSTEILKRLVHAVEANPEIITFAAAHLLRNLRAKGTPAALANQWLDQELRERGIDSSEILRVEQQTQAADQISVGNSVTALKTIGSVNWREWFERVSRVDTILRDDPANIYSRSDFVTRDEYRHRIEILAQRSKRSEVGTSEQLLSFIDATRIATQSEKTVDSRLHHVGYYLVSDGYFDFLKSLGLRLSVRDLWHVFLKRYGFAAYVGAITLLSLVGAGFTYHFHSSRGTGALAALALALVVLIPLSEFAIQIVQWLFAKVLGPRPLPKLDLELGIPDSCKTVVTIQTICSDRTTLDHTIDGLEIRYIGNEDPNIYYALLADLPDADAETTSIDRSLISHATNRIQELNERYCSNAPHQFLLLSRARRWNPSEGKWIAWERKRGKIMEFNRLLRGDSSTSFNVICGDIEALRKCQYVITLDNDTQLPPGTAAKLIGTIAHPLNKAVFEEETNIVISGYSIIQPRVGITLQSGLASVFAQVFSGHSGLDPYTRTVSDLYQDLFSEGSYVGKGIYHIDDFERALHGRVPDNALLSHDLFEGIFARAALASDIELFDEFPSRYHAHAKRQHRWVRGDWQLVPWVINPFRCSKDAPLVQPEQVKSRSSVSTLGRWKLFDNLRRSLVSPFVLLALLSVWTFIPETQLVSLLGVIILLGFPIYSVLVGGLLDLPIGYSVSTYFRTLGRDLKRGVQQFLLFIVFLPHQSYLSMHAIVTVLYRLLISRRHLLEWEPADATQRRFGSDLASFFRFMGPAIALTIGLHILVLLIHNAAILVTLPFFLSWYLSPCIAWKISQPFKTSVTKLNASDHAYLLGCAYDTWRYFDSFLIPEYHFLIPDNLQIVPKRVIAERVSPTNISLSVLSVISAYDLGFVALPAAVQRVSHTLETLLKLERFQGHFLNWYEITSLRALPPRYISTVDSGNLAGHFIAARNAFLQFPFLPLLSARHLRSIDLLWQRMHPKALFTKEILDGPSNFQSFVELLGHLELIRKKLASTADTKDALRVVEDLLSLQVLVSWIHFIPLLERLSQKSAEYRRLKNVSAILRARPPTLSLLNKLLNRLALAERVIDITDLSTEDQRQFNDFKSALSAARKQLDEIATQLSSLQNGFSKLIEEINFRFLYDEQKKLFAIGYNIDNGQRDRSYYDLLASEARVASLAAIAKGDIPQRHWFVMGRGLTNTPGGKALLSWSATMFEYLMPLLITKNFPSTLLAETCEAVVKAQRVYARRRGIPWGISESAYSGVDFEKTYQYRAFGIPGLGLKRGLADDIVVSPYSTMLALLVDPLESIKNLKRLEQIGARGEFGFIEAIDFTPERLSADESFHLVRSFLAHHQGMSLVAINNLLNNNIFQERFHRDPTIKASELLLQERFPARIPVIVPHQAELSFLETLDGAARAERSEIVRSAHTAYPRLRLISNGNYTVLLDNSGAGISMVDGSLSLTRWNSDPTSNSTGTHMYIQDTSLKETWSVTYQPTQVRPERYEVIFNPDKIEYRRRDFGIGSHLEVTVSPEDNVEVRRLTLTNISGESRALVLTSYGEVALCPQAAYAAHPAFTKLFIESEFLDDYDALLFSRRPRSAKETTHFLFHLITMPIVWAPVTYQTSRPQFIGRGNSPQNPIALNNHRTSSTSQRVLKSGAILDPIFSLQTKVEIEPGSSQVLSVVTGYARSREEAISLIGKYREQQQISRSFEMAWSQSDVELRHQQFTISQSHAFQHLANALVYNIPDFRASSDILRQNHLSQSALWRFGVSGDNPIVLLSLNDPEQAELAQELLLAHEYLRLRGLRFDLVILNEYPGGYMQDFQEELNLLIRSGYSRDFIDRPGGIFLRVRSHLSEDEVILLHSLARVVLHGTKGSLSNQLAMEEIVDRVVPVSAESQVETEAVDESPFAPNAEPCEFSNHIGGFCDDGRSYRMVIGKDSIPPQPWSNVIANPSFGFLVTESGAGYTWALNSRENRLSPWSNDPVEDPSGEVIYIRDPSSGNFWCPTPRPIPLENLVKVKHCFGYSEFTTQRDSIFSQLTISGSTTEKVKWWHLDLINGDFRERHLEIILYFEWVLGVSRDDAYRSIISGYDVEQQFVYAHNPFNIDFSSQAVFLGSSKEVESYTCSRAEFLGRLGKTSAPAALKKAPTGTSLGQILSGARPAAIRLSETTGGGFDSCAVLKISVTLAPGEKREVQFFAAQADSLPQAREKAPQYRSLKHRSSALTEVKDFWSGITQTVSVHTPNRAFDIMMNGWLLYQTLSCRMLARSGFFQSSGAYGFRDQLQDCMALLYARPDLARQQILLHAGRQFVEGDVQHWWHPPTGRGIRTRMSDNYIWLPYVVFEYMRTTGDSSILEERVPFLEGPLLEIEEMEMYNTPRIADRDGTLYEHCVIALDRALQVGPHGLPLIGCGDWNDGMNAVGIHGKGESVWLGWFIADVLEKFSAIVEQRKDNYRAQEYRSKAHSLLSCVEEHGWDGQWYRRAFFDSGQPMGSAANEECQIDSLTQSWSVISGGGQRDRQIQAMKNVYERLVRPEDRLICLLWPPFHSSNPSPGYIQGYLPGLRENGGQYTHAATWVIMATAMLGYGNKASKLFDLINPILHTSDSKSVERYQTEPYVTCGDVYSVAPHIGRGGWSWYTGSSGWLYRVALEHMIGFRQDGDALIIRPSIPSTWKEYSITYHHPHADFQIKILNPHAIQNGPVEIYLDGNKIEGDRIPIPKSHSLKPNYSVVVNILGSS